MATRQFFQPLLSFIANHGMHERICRDPNVGQADFNTPLRTVHCVSHSSASSSQLSALDVNIAARSIQHRATEAAEHRFVDHFQVICLHAHQTDRRQRWHRSILLLRDGQVNDALR